jgi:hypothetical protein
VDELETAAGSQFTGDVVEAALEVLGAGRESVSVAGLNPRLAAG